MLECVSSAGLHTFCLHLPSLQTQKSECDQGELSLKGKVLAQLSLMATRPSFSRTVNVYCQPFVSAAQLRETVIGELVQYLNPLPTNDVPMRHGLSISLWEYIWVLGAILQYMVSAAFICFLWSVKG